MKLLLLHFFVLTTLSSSLVALADDLSVIDAGCEAMHGSVTVYHRRIFVRNQIAAQADTHELCEDAGKKAIANGLSINLAIASSCRASVVFYLDNLHLGDDLGSTQENLGIAGDQCFKAALLATGSERSLKVIDLCESAGANDIISGTTRTFNCFSEFLNNF